MTATIQPPLLAWAWRIAVGDPAEVPAIVRHQDRVERGRAIDGDGLLWIVQADESELDAPPNSTRPSGGGPMDCRLSAARPAQPPAGIRHQADRRRGRADGLRHRVERDGRLGPRLKYASAAVRGRPARRCSSPRGVQLIGHSPEPAVFTDSSTGILSFSGAQHRRPRAYALHVRDRNCSRYAGEAQVQCRAWISGSRPGGRA